MQNRRVHLRFAKTVSLGSLALAMGAHAQWTVVSLDPPGAPNSRAYGVFGNRQVGVAGGRAALWTGTAQSWVALHPPNAWGSEAVAVNAEQCVGQLHEGHSVPSPLAVLWSEPSNTETMLDPAPGQENYGTRALAVFGNTQVGWLQHYGVHAPYATMWSGTPASALFLHPAGASRSEATGVSQGQQAGFAWFGSQTHAGFWTGTAESWVDLHPGGAMESAANSVHDGQQAGYASFAGGSRHAGVWSGSAASWVDLNPPQAASSEVSCVFGGTQVGFWTSQNRYRAALWRGSAASWIDLHAYLPSGFQQNDSYAKGVWSDSTVTYVVGYGFNALTSHYEALMWIGPAVPCYPNCDGSTASPALNIVDFQCFMNRFAIGAPYANCDASTSSPVLNVNDFMCFLNRFAAGCS